MTHSSFETILKGLQTGRRLGFTEADNDVTFHIAKRSFFCRYRKYEKKINLKQQEVFAKVHEYFLKHNKTRLAQFEKALNARNNSLKKRLTSWWRRLFMGQKTISKLEAAIFEIEVLRAKVFCTALPEKPRVKKNEHIPDENIQVKKEERQTKKSPPLFPQPLPTPPKNASLSPTTSPPTICTSCGGPPPPPPPLPSSSHTLQKIVDMEKVPPPDSPCLIKDLTELKKFPEEKIKHQIAELTNYSEALIQLDEELDLPFHITRYESLQTEKKKYDSSNPKELGLLRQAQHLIYEGEKFLDTLQDCKNEGIFAPNREFRFFPDEIIDNEIKKGLSKEDTNFLQALKISRVMSSTKQLIKEHRADRDKYIIELNAVIVQIESIKKSKVSGIPFKQWEEVQKKIEERKALYKRMISQRKDLVKKIPPKKEKPLAYQVTGDLGDSLKILKQPKYAAAVQQGNFITVLAKMLPKSL